MGLSKIIAKNLADYSKISSFGSKMRKNRIKPLLKMIETTYDHFGCVKLLDIGGTLDYWNIIDKNFLERNNVKITLLNLVEQSNLPENGIFSHEVCDACDLSRYEDNFYHIAHSNSVIEHVGDWDRIKIFSKEINRVAQKVYLQTPNYWFPLEPHFVTLFFHWLPYPIRIKLVLKYSLGNRNKAENIEDAIKIIENSPYLMTKEMLNYLFPKYEMYNEKFFMLTKSFIAIKDSAITKQY